MKNLLLLFFIFNTQTAFAEEELVQMLQMLNFSSQVYVWNKSLDNWKKLEDFPEIISQVTDSSTKTAA